jgi:hypothetical protein
MKTKTLNSLTKKIGVAFFALIIAFTVDSCATKAMFLTSSVVPAAQGSVKVKKDKNKNYAIKIYIYNLAQVERLQPPAQTYVICINTNDGKTRNIGCLDSNKGTFSKNLRASLKTVTSFKPIKIFITAENTDNMTYPSGQVVLTTNNF